MFVKIKKDLFTLLTALIKQVQMNLS